MKRIRRSGYVTTGLITASAGLAAMLVQVAPAANATTAVPRPIHCNPTYTFKLAELRFQNLGNPDTNSWTYEQNKSGQKQGLSLTFGTDSAVGYSIQATQSVEAGVIFAKVAASVTEGITYTHTDVYSKTATVNVPAHEYGEAGVANIYAVATGIYTHQWPTCAKTVSRNVIAKFPIKHPTGFIVDTTRSLPVKQPWALAPR